MAEEPKLRRNTGNAGKGRPKGVPNKVSKALKEMILGALDDAGGQEYLRQQASENPAAFMTLIGKVLPMSLEGKVDSNLTVITGVPRGDG
jgi:hypothetical protein